VARIVACFDHDDPHARPAHLRHRVLDQRCRNAAPLVVGIDGQDVDFAHHVFRVQADAHPAHHGAIPDRHPGAPAFGVQEALDVRHLPRPPAARVERFVDVALHGRSEPVEHRLPRPQRKLQNPRLQGGLERRDLDVHSPLLAGP
jgi:hypothetical protein